jgi:signal transduction histidine kinase
MTRFFKGIRSKFIAIYLLFGLIPQMNKSYHTTHSASASLERLSNSQLANLTAKSAEQTRRQYHEIRKDIDVLSSYPFIQLSFLQFSFGQRLETVALKLKKYKSQNELYSRISLIAPDGRVILTVPEQEPRRGGGSVEPFRLRQALGEDFFASGVLLEHPEGPSIIFSKRVYDFENPAEVVGVLAFYVHLEALAHFVEDLSPVPGAIGFLFDHQLGRTLRSAPLPLAPLPPLDPLLENGPARVSDVGTFRLIQAPVAELGWTAGLLLPQQALLGDLEVLKRKNLTVAITIAVLALLTTLFFVRRITQPIAELTRGAQAFSTGNLDHRIAIRGEGELRRLGEEFNAMASQLKARERQLRQVDRLAALGILAAGVAHEVRNPLAGIKSCAQLMQRKAISPEIGPLARGIDEEIDRLDRIVRELLEFARPGEASPAWLDLGATVARVLELAGASLEEAGIRVTKALAPVAPVWADGDQVRQVFLNLVLNAAQAMRQGGELRIGLSAADERVIASIEDNGCGIPLEHLERIFDPFFTLQPGGTGLGLSVEYLGKHSATFSRTPRRLSRHYT